MPMGFKLREWGICFAKIFRHALREQAPDVFCSNANPILAQQEDGVKSSLSPTKKEKETPDWVSLFLWRREWDSNP